MAFSSLLSRIEARATNLVLSVRPQREEVVEATVSSVVYASTNGDYAVIKLADDIGREIVAFGDLATAASGERLRLHGTFSNHEKYGLRFRVASHTPVLPTSAAGIQRFLGSGLVNGIGQKLAERLVRKFGAQTLDIIATESGRLREVSGIGAQRASSIAEAVRQRRAEADRLAFLHSLEVGPALARKIHRELGKDAPERIRRDPYALITSIDGIGFRTADKIARSIGIGVGDVRRAKGAWLHVLREQADAGHLFAPKELLIAEVVKLEVPEDVARAAELPLVLTGDIVVDGADVYLSVLHGAEVEVAKRLAGMRRRAAADAAMDARSGSGPGSGSEPGSDLGGDAASSSALTPSQSQAVLLSTTHQLAVVTGGPGTGKTTTVRAIVRACEQQKQKIVLVAPTGRAAKRLADVTGAPASTIHRLLVWNPKDASFERDESNPLDVDVLLVDESSMIDIRLALALLRSLPPRARLVLVGDADQLPPVAAGPVLRELIGSGVAPIVRLDRVFRQAAASDIVRAAHAIRMGNEPEATPHGQRGAGEVFVLGGEDADVIIRRTLAAVERIASTYHLDPKTDIQVLTATRRGPVGATILNEELQRLLNPAGDAPPGVRRGDKVMQLRNNYDYEVFNGDLGIVIDASPRRAIVRFDSREVVYEDAAIDQIALAYASTVHKAQGSEFPAVVVVAHPSQYVLLNRTLLYTALTRAKRVAVLAGHPRAFAHAIRTPGNEARSRLAERLRAGDDLAV